MNIQKLLTFGFIITAISTTLWAGGELPIYEQTILNSFPKGTTLTKKIAIIPADKQKAIKALTKGKQTPLVFSYYKAIKEDALLGYAVIGQAPSKHDWFTFLLVTDSQRVIKTVEILEYREVYGRGVKRTRFLQQFKEAILQYYPYRLSKKIDSVTGATVSSQGLIKEVKRQLDYLNRSVSFNPIR